MSLTLTDIDTLFHRHGNARYSGEPVSQLRHALQTACLAEEAGADEELVTAALLHDLGHLLNPQGETPSLRGLDDLHQYVAVPFLRGVFGPRVLDAIALHVEAKRYLCATLPEYHAALSADSQRSLALQGGVFDAAQAEAFIAKPHAADAVRLRLWDDAAKSPDKHTPPLTHYLAVAARCRLARQAMMPGPAIIAGA